MNTWLLVETRSEKVHINTEEGDNGNHIFNISLPKLRKCYAYLKLPTPIN